MRDYRYTPDGREPVWVSQMNILDIRDILADGDVCIVARDHPDETAANVLERLRIELLIRELGL